MTKKLDRIYMQHVYNETTKQLRISALAEVFLNTEVSKKIGKYSILRVESRGVCLSDDDLNKTEDQQRKKKRVEAAELIETKEMLLCLGFTQKRIDNEHVGYEYRKEA